MVTMTYQKKFSVTCYSEQHHRNVCIIQSQTVDSRFTCNRACVSCATGGVVEFNLRKIMVHFQGERRRRWKIESTSPCTNGTNGDNDSLQMKPIRGMLLSDLASLRVVTWAQLFSPGTLIKSCWPHHTSLMNSYLSQQFDSLNRNRWQLLRKAQPGRLWLQWGWWDYLGD